MLSFGAAAGADKWRRLGAAAGRQCSACSRADLVDAAADCATAWRMLLMGWISGLGLCIKRKYAERCDSDEVVLQLNQMFFNCNSTAILLRYCSKQPISPHLSAPLLLPLSLRTDDPSSDLLNSGGKDGDLHRSNVSLF